MKKINVLATVNIIGILGISITAIITKDGGQFAALLFLLFLDIGLTFALECIE